MCATQNFSGIMQDPACCKSGGLRMFGLVIILMLFRSFL
jgi:hypothetical protein